MQIRILGGGWYGCHLAGALIDAGHQVELHEVADKLFAGASGANPARLHLGFHYPRSRLTRAMCQEHTEAFMARYGGLTRAVPVNLYAVAETDSLVDFGTYCQVLRGEVEFITLADPGEFGLRHVEGAVLTGERHIVIAEARDYFARRLAGHVRFNTPPGELEDPRFDLTVDCTFSALAGDEIDRYEPCITGLLTGPADRAVTIMDGPFGSIYPWNEEACLSSLTSARLTPLSKTCRTYGEARAMLDALDAEASRARVEAMLDDVAYYWPEARQRYRIAGAHHSIRAMPKSAADARLVDVVREADRLIRVRAGKIDAIIHAERLLMEMIG